MTQFYRETYRPQFHFSAKSGWLNDPNGLVYYKGEYHLFFQYDPATTAPADACNRHWGHAVSPDLVHWTELPVAIAPDERGAVWSGSAAIDWHNASGLQSGSENAMIAMYTAAGQSFTQCMAYSHDRGRTFTKYEKNPVLPHIVGANRDPRVLWYEPDHQCIMALFMDGNTYALFSSTDLKVWTHLQDIQFPGSGECPDFFELPVDGDKRCTKWVFVGGNGNYLIGTFDGRAFARESGPHQGDWGGNYYATQTYSDVPTSDGRRIQMAWMSGGQYPDMPFNQQMNFPCELSLRTFPEGPRLCRVPVREIALLHAKEHKWSNRLLRPGDKNLLSDVAGDLFHIQAEVEPRDAELVQFVVRGATIGFAPSEGELTLLGRRAPLEAVNGRITLEIVVDRTSIEVFGNEGKVVMSSCFLPNKQDDGLSLCSAGGNAKVIRMTVYELESAGHRQGGRDARVEGVETPRGQSYDGEGVSICV